MKRPCLTLTFYSVAANALLSRFNHQNLSSPGGEIVTTQDWLPWGAGQETARTTPVITPISPESERQKGHSKAVLDQWTRAFPVGPDNAPLFLTEDSRYVLSGLARNLYDGRQVICLTGPDGVGKSTLLRQLRSQFSSAMIGEVSQPALGNLLSRLADSLRLRLGAANDLALRLALQQLFATAPNQQVIVIVDDAEALKPEELSLLLDLLDSSRAQLLLVGQAELLSLFNSLEPGRFGKADCVYDMQPLSQTETGDYIYHRLEAAGLDPNLFLQDAVTAIYDYCGGLPRLINILCFNALAESGFDASLDAEHIHAAAYQRLQSGSYPFLSSPPASASLARPRIDEDVLPTSPSEVSSVDDAPPFVASVMQEPARARLEAEHSTPIEQRPRASVSDKQEEPTAAKEETARLASVTQRRDGPRQVRIQPVEPPTPPGKRLDGKNRYEPVLWLERDVAAPPPFVKPARTRRRGLYGATAALLLVTGGVALGFMVDRATLTDLAARLGIAADQLPVAVTSGPLPETMPAPAALPPDSAPRDEVAAQEPVAADVAPEPAASEAVPPEQVAAAPAPPAEAAPAASSQGVDTPAAQAPALPETAVSQAVAEPPAARADVVKPAQAETGAAPLSLAQRRHLARLYADRAEYEKEQGRLSDAEATIRQGLEMAPRDARLRGLSQEVIAARTARQVDRRTLAAVPQTRETLRVGVAAVNEAPQPEVARLYLQRARYEWQNRKLRDALVSIGYGLEGDPKNPALLDMRQKVLAELNKRE